MAIHTRINTDIRSNASRTTLHNLSSFFNFLFDIDIAFRPGVCLWLIHLRGNLARVTQAKTSKPWVSQFWKRIVDWSLVAMVFLFAISNMAVTANLYTLDSANLLSYSGYRNYLNVRRGLAFTVLAFALLQMINITVSLFALRASQKSMNFIDPVS